MFRRKKNFRAFFIGLAKCSRLSIISPAACVKEKEVLDRRVILKLALNKCVSWNKLSEYKFEARVYAISINLLATDFFF